MLRLDGLAKRIALRRRERCIAAGDPAEPFGYLRICDSPERTAALRADLCRADVLRPRRRRCGAASARGIERSASATCPASSAHQATSILMAELFERHDRARFELFAFDNGWTTAARCARGVAAAFDDMSIDVARAAAIAQAARRSRDCEIDIARRPQRATSADARTAIFAHRPAPIQVNYLGFPGTMGAQLHRLHHRRRDRDPGRATTRSTPRRSCSCPTRYQVNDRKRRIAERTPTRARGRPARSGLRVLLLQQQLQDHAGRVRRLDAAAARRSTAACCGCSRTTPAAARNLRREARARGVAPERLVFAPRVPLDRASRAPPARRSVPRHAALQRAHDCQRRAVGRVARADLRSAATFAGRVAASLLHAAGLPELVTR